MKKTCSFQEYDHKTHSMVSCGKPASALYSNRGVCADHAKGISPLDLKPIRGAKNGL
jgi:hypothetical protein